jgi:hypothetical protein
MQLLRSGNNGRHRVEMARIVPFCTLPVVNLGLTGPQNSASGIVGMDITERQENQSDMEIGKDTSVAEARWMLASVAFLVVAVFAAGVLADMLTR